MVRVAGFEPTASWSRIAVWKSTEHFCLRLALFSPNPGASAYYLLRCFRRAFCCRGSGCGSSVYYTVFEEGLLSGKEAASRRLKFCAAVNNRETNV